MKTITHRKTMKINESKLKSLLADNWQLVIYTPYSGKPVVLYGDQEHMISLCNCDGQTLEYVAREAYEAQKAEDEEGQWCGEWEGEGWYGRYNEAGEYQHISNDAGEAIYQILSHDSSNNFSWRGNAEEAIADVGRHRLIREALETEGVIDSYARGAGSLPESNQASKGI